MKKTTRNQLQKLWLLSCFLLLTLKSYSQNPVHWTLSMDVCNAVDVDKIEFNLYIEFDGTVQSPIPSTMEMAAYSFGINYNPAILNGGAISISQVAPRDPQLSNLNNPSFNVQTPGHIQLTTSPKPIGFGFVVKTLTKYFLGRFRLTGSIPFTPNTAIVFSPQCSLTTGFTSHSATYYLNGATAKTATTFSMNPPQPAMNCSMSASCSGLIVNPQCPIALIGAASYNGCGPVNINCTVTNTFDSIRWSTSGSGTFGFPTSSGLNIYTPGNGETGSILTLKVYKSGCSNSIATAIYSNSINPLIKTTISTCNNYTWPVNGQTYTTTGIYTHKTTNITNCITNDSLFLSINTHPPAIPVSIKITGGTSSVCPGESRTYHIVAVPGASSYTWTPPVGATITNGQGTLSVLVTYNAGFVAGDTIRVKSNNGCSSSLDRNLRVARSTPSTPGPITGQPFGLCHQILVPYSVTNVAGITYTWSFSVAGAGISSGQGNNAVFASFGSAFVSGTIRVKATNACGTSALRTLIIRATPTTPVSITGASSVCVNQFGVPYSITPVASATNYTWTCPNNARINDGVVTSTTTSLLTTATAVTVNFASISGLVRVRANNACGKGDFISKKVNFVCREEMKAGNDFSVTCYPQPASGLLNVSFNSFEEADGIISLSDITGKIIQLKNIKTDEGKNLFSLDVSDIESGIYILEVINGDLKSIHKIMIE